jgi:hypothetical protein
MMTIFVLFVYAPILGAPPWQFAGAFTDKPDCVVAGQRETAPPVYKPPFPVLLATKFKCVESQVRRPTGSELKEARDE